MTNKILPETPEFASPSVTVLGNKYVKGMTEDDRVQGIPLAEALSREWPTDAHFTAYAPRTDTVDGTDRRVLVRLLSQTKGDGLEAAYDCLGRLDVPFVEMVALIGDVDDPVAHETGEPARDEWRAEQAPRLAGLGLPYYETRGGYRVIGVLDEPFPIRTREDAATWSECYLAWCAGVERATGLIFDRACADWTRCYRLPNVERDGAGPQRAELVGTLAPYDPQARGHLDFNAATAAKPRPDRTTAETTIGHVEPERTPRATAIANEIRPVARDGRQQGNGVWNQFHGWCLGKRCTEGECMAVAHDVLEGDPKRDKYIAAMARVHKLDGPTDAVKEWLGEEIFAAVDKILREINRERDPSITALAANAKARAENDSSDGDGDSGKYPGDVDWTVLGPLSSFAEKPAPIEYLCRGLCLASSKGKISLIAGQPGAGKGPIAAHLALCFALGLKAFGVHECEQTNVMILDWEGARLTHERLWSQCEREKRDPRELDGRLFHVDASAAEIDSERGDPFWTALENAIERHAIGVVVVDSYTTASLGLDAEANSPKYAALAKRFAALGVLVIVVAHANKAAASREGAPRLGDVANSFAIGALAQTAIVAWHPLIRDEDDDGKKAPPEEDLDTVVIACARAPHDRFTALTLTRANGWHARPAELGAKVAAAKVRPVQKYDDRPAKARKILEYFGGLPHATSRTVRDVRTAIGGKYDHVSRILYEMSCTGLVTRETYDRGERYGRGTVELGPLDGISFTAEGRVLVTRVPTGEAVDTDRGAPRVNPEELRARIRSISRDGVPSGLGATGAA